MTPLMPGPLPQVNALLFCDQAFQQAVTGKWCLIGTFGMIWVREFPTVHAPLLVFVSLSDFGGGATVQLSLRDPEGGHMVSVRVQLPALPVTSFELPLVFPSVTFATAGVHTIELFAGGELLTVRSLRVDKVDPTKPPFGMMLGGPPAGGPFGPHPGPVGMPPGFVAPSEPGVGPD